MTLHVALHGGYHDDNFGDLLLLALFGRWVEDNHPGAVRCSFPLVPGDGVERFRTHLPGALTGRRRLLSASGLIYAGGGHFGEPDAGSGHAYGGAWNERFLARHVMPARAFRLRRRRWLVAGVGAGPLHDARVREAARRVFDGAWAVSVRDEASARFLVDDLGIERPPLVCPDPALALRTADLPADARAAADAILAALPPGPVLGIHHPRDWLLDAPGAAAMRDALFRALARAPDIVPLVFSDNAVNDAGNRLAAEIETVSNRRCASVRFDTLWKTAALIGRLQAVLTTKLHVGIVAYALGVHARAFAIHPKVPRLSEQIGHDERCLVLRDVTPASAEASIAAALDAARGARSSREADERHAEGSAGVDGAGETGSAKETKAVERHEALRNAALGNAALVAAYGEYLRGERRDPPTAPPAPR